MTLLYTDSRFLNHRTGKHPEQPARLESVLTRLTQADLVAQCGRRDCTPITLPRLARVHDPRYSEQVRAFCTAGGGQIESDTIVSRESFDVALLAAGTACDAVEQVVRGDDQNALCLIRPPGHHALPAATMGFCLFNNVAIAARTAIAEYGLDRILIVDWDVHHGNGTQDTFYDDGQVAFLSIHRSPFYPGTGAKDETGSGAGLGMTKNLPLKFGVSRVAFLSCFRCELETFADKVRPELVLLSAGFDAHHDDPVGSLGLESKDFTTLTQIVREVANVHAGGRIVSLLEGGYNLQALAESVELHLRALLS